MPDVRPNALGRALRGFLADDLSRVRGASRHTVLSYRDALKLLLRFLAARYWRRAAALDFPDLAPEHVLAFLDHLETDRASGVSTRNARLAAVQSFARYAAARYPEHLELRQGILALPVKPGPQRVVEYLEADEMRALLQAPDLSTPDGRRDQALLLFMYTGARVQEVLDLRRRDLQPERPLQARLVGKRRKERVCPLLPETAEALRAFLREADVGPADDSKLFRNRLGQPLTRFGVRYLLSRHAGKASEAATTLRDMRVHPHVLPYDRHALAPGRRRPRNDQSLAGPLRRGDHVPLYRGEPQDETRCGGQAGPLGAVDSEQAAWQQDATILEWLEAL